MKHTRMRNLAALLLAVLLLVGCGTAGQPARSQEAEEPTESLAPAESPPEQETEEETESAVRDFTDSCGRTVSLPAEIRSVAVSGPLAQLYVFPLCPELMVGLSKAFSGDMAKYMPEEYMALPELGQLYGGKGTMDLEALLAAAPDVVIDVGEAKGSIVEDMDALTEQTGIPFVHIDATVATAPAAYRLLGELTGKNEKAEELASWCEGTLARMEDIMARVDADGARKSLVYCLGDKGLNCLAEGSYHAETVNLMGQNVAVLPDVVSSGLGNEIDMEQLILWDPEVIVFSADSIYDTVGQEESWQPLQAIRNGEYYKVPVGPYGWLSSPPSVQRYLGMLWLGAVLYPDYVDYELQEQVSDYYRLFYGYELSDSDYAELTAGALK